MKINRLIPIFFLFFVKNSFAQTSVSIDNKQFYAPQTGNYLEFYSSIDPVGFKLEFVKDSGLICKVNELILVRQGEKIIDFRKKIITSPYFSDSSIYSFNSVERFKLNPGKYVVEYECSDALQTNGQPLRTELLIEVFNRENKTCISQIELIEKASATVKHPELTKSGYEIHPYVSSFYPEEIEKLAYYAELYFTEDDVKDGQKFILTQFLTNFDTDEKIEGFAKMSKITAQVVSPILNTFDIKNLPTGNYNLVIELRNRNNEVVVAEKIFIQRLNFTSALSDQAISQTTVEGTFVDQINSNDSLNMFISSVRPIATNGESDMAVSQMKTGNVMSKKQYFLLFWRSRDPKNPEGAWLKYKAEVKKVDKMFSTKIKRGHETDRGRIYLKYGAPNQVTDRPNEPSAYPYQIWQYYRLGKFNNKFFLFYMPDLVSNDYEILNSDVPGEFRNPKWEAVLYSRDTQNPNIDFPTKNNTNHYGGNVNELLRNPR